MGFVRCLRLSSSRCRGEATALHVGRCDSGVLRVSSRPSASLQDFHRVEGILSDVCRTTWRGEGERRRRGDDVGVRAAPRAVARPEGHPQDGAQGVGECNGGASGEAALDPSWVARVVELAEGLGGGGGAQGLLQLAPAAAVPHGGPGHDDHQLRHQEHGARQDETHHVDAHAGHVLLKHHLWVAIDLSGRTEGPNMSIKMIRKIGC